MIKRTIIIILAIIMGVVFFTDEDDLDAFLEDDDYYEEDDENYEDMSWAEIFGFDDDDDEPLELIGKSGDPDQTWSLYWYLCGSDLESENGAATDDLYELMEVDLPDNVQVVIQTGGAYSWQNDFVNENRIQRYLYSSDGLELVDEQPQANMGDPETLADFLYFAGRNFPADKTGVIFWNHGGGSVAGVSFDENYEYDSLTLEELYQAFDAVFELSEKDPPFELIGFDACLMATIDTAYTFADVGRYLVASEEWEPGSGWEYEGFMTALADDPGMDGARLGQYICESYIDGCGWLFEDDATLSVVDMSRLAPLMEAYESMGAEALSRAVRDPYFFSEFGRMAENTENYGGNTRDQGYTNMVDLGHLAENCSFILPRTSDAVRAGLEECVVYQVKGDLRENASGLSCYYSYNGDPEDFYGFIMQGCSDSFKYLFNYELEGDLPREGMEYVQSLGYKNPTLPPIPGLEDYAEKDFPLSFDKDDNVVLKLEPDTVNMLKSVTFQLAYIDEEQDLMILLGQDNDMYADWENGTFTDNFRGVWGAIDGHPVYMEISYESDDYTAYSVPVLLNGEEYNLRVIYDYEDEKFFIAGARKGLDDNGMADKNLRELKPGDEITTIHYASSISGDDGLEAVPAEVFKVTKKTSFEEADMGDGVFLMMFELTDAKNETAYSQMVQFTVDGDYMDVEIID